MSKGKSLTEQAIDTMDNLLKKPDAELISDFENHKPQGFGELLERAGLVVNSGNTYLKHLQQVEKEIEDNPDMLSELAKDYEPSEAAKEFAQLERYIMSQDTKKRDDAAKAEYTDEDNIECFKTGWDASRAESDAEIKKQALVCISALQEFTATYSEVYSGIYGVDLKLKDARIAELENQVAVLSYKAPFERIAELKKQNALLARKLAKVKKAAKKYIKALPDDIHFEDCDYFTEDDCSCGTQLAEDNLRKELKQIGAGE